MSDLNDEIADLRERCDFKDKRIAELEALVSLAKTNWKAREATYKNSMDAIEAIAKERKERIAELEKQADMINDRREFLHGQRAQYAERIVALEALLERSDHDWITDANKCHPDCPKCAYERTKIQ